MPRGYFRLTPKFRQLRAVSGLTQAQFAKKARTDQTYLSEIERGLNAMGVALTTKLCRVLGRTIEEALADGIIVMAVPEGDSDERGTGTSSK